MRLLVSVRSAAEAMTALEGGAEIVDAKEPSRGSLGAVSLPVLQEIDHAVPADLPLSVALADPATPRAAADAVEAVARAVRSRDELYVKLGLAGVRQAEAAEALLAATVGAAARLHVRASVIAVAYADYAAAGAPSPAVMSGLAAHTGARGVLIDTFSKGGADLFAHLAEAELRSWVERAGGAGLLVALAGSLSVGGVRRAARLPADIIGVRGAACAGGREGRVDASRVRQLRASLEPTISAHAGTL
ncbi:MAG TPA: (5-formylfuran-3-yl)methyl phosphate synthase [Gemmatimonadales bacterium]|nr:(5-formylfuran-3-yl)methyl phosphate synthase [Gemmatimonadales bacterium]